MNEDLLVDDLLLLYVSNDVLLIELLYEVLELFIFVFNEFIESIQVGVLMLFDDLV
jgi:hypothetical protein